MSNSKVKFIECTLNGSYVGVVHSGDGGCYMAFTFEVNDLTPELKLYHPEIFIPTIYDYHLCHESTIVEIQNIIDYDKPKQIHCEECMGKGHTNDGPLGTHNCEACDGKGIRK